MISLEQKFNRFVTSDLNGKLRNREETFLGTCICKTWNVSIMVETALIWIVALVIGFLTYNVIRAVRKGIRASGIDQNGHE